MKTHTIEVKDLTEWKAEQRILFASSTKEGKRLFANLNGGYEIEVKGVKVFECIQPFQAVEKYNSII
jgi:hypothetical protein